MVTANNDFCPEDKRIENDSELFKIFIEDLENGSKIKRTFVNYAYSFLRDFHLAEDAYHNFLLNLSKGNTGYKYKIKPRGFNANPKLLPWTYASINHACIDIHRRRNNGINKRMAHDYEPDEELTMDSRQESPLEIASRREEEIILKKIVASLKKPLRKPVNMYYFQGLKYQEIARILKTPVGTIKTRLYDARQILREILSSEEIEGIRYKSAA
jgi:RNA polymerase sigma factor (sigma-70 family)